MNELQVIKAMFPYHTGRMTFEDHQRECMATSRFENVHQYYDAVDAGIRDHHLEEEHDAFGTCWLRLNR